jgi:hypothetical protein
LEFFSVEVRKIAQAITFKVMLLQQFIALFGGQPAAAAAYADQFDCPWWSIWLKTGFFDSNKLHLALCW